ncbi:hypothetical protein ACLKA7_004596 [Drosophila subpalustris]
MQNTDTEDTQHVPAESLPREVYLAPQDDNRLQINCNYVDIVRLQQQHQQQEQEKVQKECRMPGMAQRSRMSVPESCCLVVAQVMTIEKAEIIWIGIRRMAAQANELS